MKIQIILRNGRSVVFHADSITKRKGPTGELVGLEWERSDDRSLPSLFSVRLDQVDAIVTTDDPVVDDAGSGQ